MCWLKTLIQEFVLAETSCSRICVGSNLLFRFLSYCSGFVNCLFVWLWSNQLLEKKKKKSKNLIWFLFFSCSCSWSGSGSCSCSCACSCSCSCSCSYSGSCSCFLGLITNWDKTRFLFLFLDWVQLVLEELEWDNSWGKRQESVRLLSKKKNSQLRVKYEWSAIIRV